MTLDIEKLLSIIDNILKECKNLTIEEFLTITPMVFDYFTADKGMNSEETIKAFEKTLDSMKAAHALLGQVDTTSSKEA